jgi:thiosulfate dehydrogenase [quinone] large subunit
MNEHVITTRQGRIIEDPPLARFLFGDTRIAAFWLVLRVLVGGYWLHAGLEKLSNPAWTQTGQALKGFWTAAVQVPATGRPPIAYAWYRSFIQGLLNAGTYTWFAKLVVAGELLVGIALIIGAFVGIAAFFGAFMDLNYIMAGSASVNGLLGVAGILLILAWKVAGYYGADYYLLRWLGTPWHSRNDDKTPSVDHG